MSPLCFVRCCAAVLLLASLLSLVLCAEDRIRPADILRSFPASRAPRYLRALRTSSVPLRTSLPSAPSSSLFLPSTYGADPSGATDSSAAFSALLHDLLSANHSHRLANGIVDLGGATIDLEGGDFLLSSPLVLPFCIGNVRIQRGTLRASASFPNTSYLLVIGSGSSKSCAPTGQDTVMENVAVSELMLDGAQRAAGCVIISSIMGAVLGPNNFILGFTEVGISVVGGHEVQISNSWFGQYLYDDPRKERGHALGISIRGNDHVVSDVVVYSAQTGIYVQGAANLIQNAHTWNQANGNHGVGIMLDSAGYDQNRIVACYLDWNDLVVLDPEHLVVSDAFFLGGGALLLRATTKSHSINGLSVTDCEFDDGGGVAAIQLDESAASFTGLTDCRIEGNMLDSSYHSTGTRAQRRATFTHSTAQSNATHCVDLTQALLFPQFPLTSTQVTISVNDTSFGLPLYAVVPGSAPGLATGDARSVCVAVRFVGAEPSPSVGSVQLTIDLSVDQSSYSFGRVKGTHPQERRTSQAVLA